MFKLGCENPSPNLNLFVCVLNTQVICVRSLQTPTSIKLKTIINKTYFPAHIKEALEEDCAKCTKTQRDGTRQVMGHLINHEVEFWNQLKAKYDPQSKYSAKHEQELRKLKQ